MGWYRNDASFTLAEQAPEAEEILQSYTIDDFKQLHKRDLTEAIVKARIDTGLVVLTRSQIQQYPNIPTLSHGTFTNRLTELVEIGILSVDTTPNAHQYTLAVPLAEPAVPLDKWQKDLESFRPTDLDNIPARSPSHAELPAEISNGDSNHLPTQDLRYASMSTAATRVVPSGPNRLYAAFESGSASTNQYATPTKIVWASVVVSVLCSIVAISLFGSPPVGLGFLLVGLGFFSLWIPLWLAKYVTTEWTDPVDIRPSDFISIFR